MKPALHSSRDNDDRDGTDELTREMVLAGRSVEQRHIDAIRALGVSSQAIAEIGKRQYPFGFGQIADLGGGRFSFFPGGQARVIMPVIEHGEIIDLIAWQTSQPSKWLWRNGLGDFLRSDLIGRSQWDDRHALKVVPTPLAWLQAAGEAVCILNWKAPRSELERLRLVDEIMVSDAGLARQLTRALTQPRPIPRIRVQESPSNA